VHASNLRVIAGSPPDYGAEVYQFVTVVVIVDVNYELLLVIAKVHLHLHLIPYRKRYDHQAVFV